MDDDSGESVASNFFWAVALIIIVMTVMGALFYSGILSGRQKTDIDIDVSAPAR